jgi:hypothetical protein
VPSRFQLPLELVFPDVRGPAMRAPEPDALPKQFGCFESTFIFGSDESNGQETNRDSPS